MLQIGFVPKVVRDGRKVFLMEIEELGIKFLRSNNYFAGSEYEIAKMFDITFQKRFFPNRFPDMFYKGCIPKEEYFFDFKDTKTIRQEKLDFIQNFKENNLCWCFEKELVMFSEQKLNILTMAFLKFIKECFLFQCLLQNNGEERLQFIHPLGNNVCSTSSFIYKVYKLFYLNNFEIYSIKNEFGCNLSKEISAQEYEWSSYMQFIHPDLDYRSDFSHFLGKKIFPECVPDLYSSKTCEAVFYNGCYYHAHVHDCLINPNVTPQTKHPLFKKTYEEINNAFNKKIALLLNNHPLEVKKVTIIWECQYLEMRKHDSDLKLFLSKIFQPRPLFRLRPRTAVRGSFTECFALKWLKTENSKETFYCLDVNGMYSYIGLTSKFGIGTCKVIIGKEIENITLKNGQYFYKDSSDPMIGTMMVTILPPKKLFFPFLPYRLENDTSIFTLCLKCAENNLSICKHSDTDRSFTSVYFISELVFALKLGYAITTIFECHYYEKSDFILQDFIKKLACLRLQNSNLFHNLSTNDEKESCCDQLNTRMNFQQPFNLNINNICYNEGKRNFYKTMMNSIFGKLEQRSDKPKTVYVNSQEELEKYYFSDSIITSIFCINENVCELELKTNNEKLPPNRENNSYIGGELVAYGRMLMYEIIQKIDPIGKLFYVDCDSCFFSLPSNTILPFEISEVFGAFKNVYPGEILSFHCIAPKNYAISFKTSDNKIKHITKIKGLSLSSYYLENEINTATFNYFLSKFLKDEIEKKEITQLRCRKVKKSKNIVRKIEVVRFSNQITNRRIIIKECKYITSVPYGYNNE
jgi:G:T-mismatch repair DNA endonuclease (very short patch repair protein)